MHFNIQMSELESRNSNFQESMWKLKHHLKHTHTHFFKTCDYANTGVSCKLVIFFLQHDTSVPYLKVAAFDGSKKDAGKAVLNLMMYFLAYVSCAVSTLLDLKVLLSKKPGQPNVSPASRNGNEILFIMLWLHNVPNRKKNSKPLKISCCYLVFNNFLFSQYIFVLLCSRHCSSLFLSRSTFADNKMSS